MRYAMILKNRVIGILPNQETEPYWPPDPSGNQVTAIPCDDTVKLGMMYDTETGEFSEYIPTEPEQQLQSEQELTQLDRIEEKLNMLSEGIVSKEYMDYYTAVSTAILGGE